MSSASKEVVIKDTVCELRLEECILLDVILKGMAKTILLRIANLVPQLVLPIMANHSKQDLIFSLLGSGDLEQYILVKTSPLFN